SIALGGGDPDELLEDASQFAEPGSGRVLGRVERLMQSPGQAGQILGVLEPVRLLLERLLLALLQLRPLDLLGLEAEEIGALLDLATPAVEVLERAACADEPVVCRPRLRSQRFGPREGVQDRTLLIGSEQRLVLVL